MQGCDDADAKRIGNLGELAFEQFRRECLPVETWEWRNEAAVRRCNPDSFRAHDFEVFGYEVDAKTSRDVSSSRPANLLAADPDDDVVVMVWHRDNEDAFTLLGWEPTRTLASEVETQASYSGEEPEKLAHLAVRPMNEPHDLGPNTAHPNRKPENPFAPGDRVVRAGDDAAVGVVVEVLPPEADVTLYGRTIGGEAVRVAFPEALDDAPGDWRATHPAKLASHCDDGGITLYAYNHTNLEHAPEPFGPGDYVHNPDYHDPDPGVVVTVGPDGEADVAFLHQLGVADDDPAPVAPADLSAHCESAGVDPYPYPAAELAFERRY